MKKFYFSLVAAMMLSASTAAYAQDGKTCETALPYTGNLQVTETTWFTFKFNSLTMFPSIDITPDVATLTIFEGCDGEEAFSQGVNSYFLYPDIEYKIKVEPQKNSILLPKSEMGLSLAGAPAGMYCVNPIKIEPDPTTGAYTAVKQRLGRTLWYQRNIAMNGNLNFTKDGVNPCEGLTKVELKRGDCKAVSSIGEATEITPGLVVAPSPFAKAGTNLMAITFAASTDPEVTEGQFVISQNAIAFIDCNNRPERMPAIELDKETGVQNGYYVKDYQFTPATAGTYSFVCKAAEGTVFNVGTIEDTGEKRNPGTEYESPIYECRYEINDPVIVNSSNEAAITLTLEAGKKYVMHYDSDYALEGATPSMKAVEGTYSSINSIEMNKKTDVMVSENPTDGNFTVSSYLLPDCGEIALYDMGANKVFSTKSQGGKEQNIQLTNVKSGVYLLVVYGRGRSACTKLIVK